MTHRAHSPSTHARAFSLIELLVVITIIGIVIGITVPAIGGARDLARANVARSQMQSLSTAVSAFQTDTLRVPGYFTAADMADNQDGFTGMQNVLLDLAGGPISEDQANTNANSILVGPNGNAQVDEDGVGVGPDEDGDVV